MSNKKTMDPMTGDTGRNRRYLWRPGWQEVTLKRGDEFPADLVLGRSTYELQGFAD